MENYKIKARKEENTIYIDIDVDCELVINIKGMLPIIIPAIKESTEITIDETDMQFTQETGLVEQDMQMEPDFSDQLEQGSSGIYDPDIIIQNKDKSYSIDIGTQNKLEKLGLDSNKSDDFHRGIK